MNIIYIYIYIYINNIYKYFLSGKCKKKQEYEKNQKNNKNTKQK